MGWNSRHSFARNIDEATFRKTADRVSSDLKRFGRNYVVIDEGWYLTNPTDDVSQYRFAMTARKKIKFMEFERRRRSLWLRPSLQP